MKAVIVANGYPSDPASDRHQIEPGDLVIAADGGVDYCRKLGIAPAVIIGDMDSIARDTEKMLSSGDTELIRHPVHKDATDLELAIRLALERGARSLVILGALGGRWDMSIGNLFLLALPELKGIPVKVIDGRQEIVLLTGKDTAVFHGNPGDTLSLIPAGENAAGITLEGLEYPLVKGTLLSGSSRGISNVLQSDKATVSLESGTLICVLIHKTIKQATKKETIQCHH